MIQLYVKYLYPGTFFNEERISPIDSVKDIEVPDTAYGYQTFKREILTSPETENECKSASFDHTAVEYVDADYYTLKQLKEHFPEEHVLISNIEGNGYRGAIRTRRRNWQGWEK